jgi:hypothetical protein
MQHESRFDSSAKKSIYGAQSGQRRLSKKANRKEEEGVGDNLPR